MLQRPAGPNKNEEVPALLRTLLVVAKMIAMPLMLAWLPLAWILRQLLGNLQWQAPAWWCWMQQRFYHFAVIITRRPLRFMLLLILLVSLSVAAVLGYRWWQAQPRPVEVEVSIVAPGRTELEQEDPQARLPKPLQISFDHSVAPLADSGKDISQGITIKPALAGTWHWRDDKILTFTPTEDWPVGASYTVSWERSLVRPEIRLATYQASFQAPVFKIDAVGEQFYQDPVTPSIKQAVFELRFSHPVNTAELEKRIQLRLTQQGGVLGSSREDVRFTVSYDKLKLRAYIRSTPLAIPKEDSELGLSLVKGVTAARGGPASEQAFARRVRVPGLYSLRVNDIQTRVATNDKGEPEQVLVLTTSATVHEREMKKAIRAWVLPKTQLDENGKPQPDEQEHRWRSDQITEAVLKRSRPLPLEQVAAEFENTREHAFRYSADVGAQLYVQVQAGIQSFGGYLMSKPAGRVLGVPAFPAELKILSQGSLLALSGERKLAVLVRDLPGIKMEIGRVLPGQLQHLVSQADGDFSKPQFYGRFGQDNLVERFQSQIPLPQLAQGKAHYEAVDLSQYLKGDGQARRGVFLVSISSYDPAAEQRARLDQQRKERQVGEAPASSDDEADDCEQDCEAGDNQAAQPETQTKSDQRLVVVTDLGIVLKRSLDGSQDVFVQSIYDGKPVEAAQVEVIGRNGQALMSQNTDAGGRVHFAKIDGMSRERAPLMILVRKGNDMSFLPLNKSDRALDMSRFDVGGARNAQVQDQVSAYLFSDRGIYRPGETMHFGLIVKSADWGSAINGLPLETELIDARGLTVKREKIKIPPGGFVEVAHTTQESAPTGSYSLNLYLVRDGKPGAQLGSTTVKVQEFQPDRMKLSTRLVNAEGPALSEGWIHPQQLKGQVSVQNLFGTPAENRRVTAQLSLAPAFPAFRQFPDYQFYDPQRATETYNEDLGEQSSDQKGEATFDLGLGRYTRATYRLQLLTRAYEAQGGRGVAAQASALVSEMPFLIGFKADGALDYVSRGARRTVSLLAINPKVERTEVSGLRLRHIERKFVSVLTRQSNGNYRYESRKKEVLLDESPLNLPVSGYTLALDSAVPGNFSYVIRDAQGQELNRIDYAVAGQGNVSRNLERNAELQLSLNKKDYQPGEEIEVSIRAPYAGAGLITIERDRVFTHQWFRATTQSSVQKIRLPKDFEGNGYVSVQFIRDPSSDEIFMSPLSYGVVPFATSLASRTNKLALGVPDLVKPGQPLKIKLNAARPTRAVVFAVDEGILQVARYQSPEPLNFFFQKRMLEVSSAQILDLILPEFKRLIAASAPGGDSDGDATGNLNPFKRKHDKPAIYWSGIVEVKGSTELTYQVPDSFNGSLRVMAVAVDEKSIGTAQAKTLVRGDFVLSPNVPLAVAPGDEFDVSVGVANNVAGSGKDANVNVTLKTSPHLVLVAGTAGASQQVKIGEGREGVVSYRLRAVDGAQTMLGAASVQLNASIGGKQSRLVTELSVRPATARYTLVSAGAFKGTLDVPIKRQMYPQYRTLEVGVSGLPLVLAQGMSAYLTNFPHQCTEQMVSQAVAELVLSKRPEFARADASLLPARSLAETFGILRTRQNEEGGYGLWTASLQADEFASVYATHLLLEARERGEAVPADMLQKSLDYLRHLAGGAGGDLAQLRVRAYAAYLLTRQMVVTTPMLTAIRESLERQYPKQWRSDLAAGYLAAAYQLQKQNKLADELMDSQFQQLLAADAGSGAYEGYYSTDIHDAQTLYLLARHFPQRVKALPPTLMQRLVKPVADGRFNTLSAAYLVMALDAYGTALGQAGATKLGIVEIDAAGKQLPLSLPANLVPRVPFSAQAASLRLSGDNNLNTYYAVVESGFDRGLPKEEMRSGMQVFREFLGSDGKPTSTVNVGDELVVRLRLVSTQRAAIGNVALVDLLPGGFEAVLQSEPASATANADESGDQSDAQQEATATAQLGSLAGSAASAPVQYVDVREDRVLFYTGASKQIGEITYRIKATNSGRFLVPPAYAESMYERNLQARTVGGQVLTVNPPASKR